jgi:hypothetical protein
VDQAIAPAADATPASSAACPIPLTPGERYAGAIVNPDGTLSHHLVLLPNRPENRLSWPAAKAWAASVDGDLPTRREQSLLFANTKDAFEPAWYWSSEQYEGDGAYAWSQDFDYGYQSYGHTSYEGRVRAVRRVTA